MNKLIIIGNLGQDPELRYTQAGKAVCNFSVATNDSYGEREHTEWHRVVVWGTQAENCEKYLAKGRRVAVDGRVQTREWEDRDGAKRYTTEVVAARVEFLGGDGERSSRPRSEPTPEPGFDQSFDDVDIPF